MSDAPQPTAPAAPAVTEPATGAEVQPPAPAPAAPKSPVALVLLDIGGPADARDAGAFLQRLYGDPHVLQMSMAGTFLDLIAWGISLTRGGALKKALSACGGQCPERAGLQELAAAIAPVLAEKLSRPVQPFVAFRHAQPDISKTLEQAQAAGCRRVMAVFARTFSSPAGSGSARKELSLCTNEFPDLDISMMDGFEDDASVRQGFGNVVRAALESLPASDREAAHLLFTLQGQPVKGRTDPTLSRGRAFAEAVRAALGVPNPFSVAYQSEVDPRATLLPAAAAEIDRLAAEKCRALVVVPLSHACETLATHWELDQVLVPRARAAGIGQVARATAPALDAGFRTAFAGLVVRHAEEMEQLRAAP